MTELRFFSRVHGTFIKIDHSQNWNLQGVFSDNIENQLDFNKRKVEKHYKISNGLKIKEYHIWEMGLRWLNRRTGAQLLS